MTVFRSVSNRGTRPFRGLGLFALGTAGGSIRRWRHLLAAAAVVLAALANGEQFERFGDWQVHYIAFNASLLPPEVAERHGLVRGRNKGLVNITAVGPAGPGAKVTIAGNFRNLIGQSFELDFREIVDGEAYYYLAAFDFDNAETLRFEIEIDLPEHGTERFRFQQPLYFSE